MKRGGFITLEGPDGCGKSTQAKRLAERLRNEGFRVCLTREPGGTDLAENLRSIILDPSLHIHPLTELMLYEASRAQHTAEIILPALRKKEIVICDRYYDATMAYQGYGRRLDLKNVKTLNTVAAGGLKPDLTILLDISSKEGLSRATKNGADRMEKEKLAFHSRVRRGYLEIAKKEPRRIKIISGSGTVEEVHEKIWDLIKKKCLKK